MRCPGCGADGAEDARFCAACGTALGGSARCPACSATLPPNARFCPGCGAAAGSAAPPAPARDTPAHLAEKILGTRTALQGERKQVTVLFADVKGSMDL